MEPLLVLQTNHDGSGVVVGLAVEKCRDRRVSSAEDDTDFSPTRSRGALPDKTGTESTSRASTAWADLRPCLRRSRRYAIQPKLSVVPRSLTIDRLAASLSEDVSSKLQEQAASKLAELSAIEEHRSAIAGSFPALKGLSRILSVDNLNLRYHAAVALGNLAAIQENLKCFTEFPEILTGLVSMLFQCDDVLVQRGAALALLKLSLWREGGKMILNTARAIEGLTGLAMAVRDGCSGGTYCGQNEAKRALLNLALVPENKAILDCPLSLPVFAGFLSPHNKDRLEQEHAVQALASLSYTRENAKKIAESVQFPLFVAVLVRFLGYSRPATCSAAGLATGGDGGLAARKKAAIALANLSITDGIQRMVAEFPDALSGLFTCLRVQENHGERALCLQLQECAAMAIGNLALARANRKKIMDFCSNAGGLAAFTSLLFQDDNPGGQEYATWALANLSHDSYESKDIAVTIARSPNVVRGLVRLLQLPTPDLERSGSRSRIGVQEQALRALANLAYPHENRMRIARVPDVAKALAAALLSRHFQPNPSIPEHAARALANLTSAEENWRSPQIFGDAIRSLVDLLSVENGEASPKSWRYGAITLGNFALAPAHHRAIVMCKQAMTGLVSMLFRCDSPLVGKEDAARTLANLAQYGDFSTKAAIASFPFVVTGLLGLLSDREDSLVQDQARRALAGLQDVVLDDYVSRISVTSATCDVRSSRHRPFSTFEISSRAEACS